MGYIITWGLGLLNEINFIFTDYKEKTKTFSYGELLKLFQEKTGKKGSSTFYGFLREVKAFGFCEEQRKNQYTIFLDKIRGYENAR